MTIHPVTFFLSCFLYALTTLLLTVSPAHAFLGKEKIPALKTEVHISKAEFEARTDLIEEEPFQNKDLAFHVRLPKGWIKLDSNNEKTEVSADLFRQLSSYISPPRLEHRSMFRVKSIDLTSLITVDDWFIGYMLQMGFSVEGMTVVNPRKIIAQYAVFEDGEPYVTRAVVTLTGSKIILAEYLVHQEVYEKEKDEQIWAMTGFDLNSPNTDTPVVMKTFSFVDIAKFDYPANWQIYSPGITQIDRMDASVLNTVNTHMVTSMGSDFSKLQITGRIDVSVVSKSLGTSLPDEIETINKGLKEKKYKLGKFIETLKTVDLNPGIKTGRVDVYDMESEVQKLAGYEYWIAVLQTDSRYYFIQMVTVARGENFVTWAQNTETYRVLLKSLSPASVDSSY